MKKFYSLPAFALLFLAVFGLSLQSCSKDEDATEAKFSSVTVANYPTSNLFGENWDAADSTTADLDIIVVRFNTDMTYDTLYAGGTPVMNVDGSEVTITTDSEVVFGMDETVVISLIDADDNNAYDVIEQFTVSAVTALKDEPSSLSLTGTITTALTFDINFGYNR